MTTIDNYLDTARELQDLPSDRQLALRLGITDTSLNAFRQKKSWPADHTMIALAALAGMDVSQALIDLNCWRSKSPEARSAYQHLALKLKAVAVALALVIFGAVSTPAEANKTGTSSHQAETNYILCALFARIARYWRKAFPPQFVVNYQ